MPALIAQSLPSTGQQPNLLNHSNNGINETTLTLKAQVTALAAAKTAIKSNASALEGKL